YDFASGGLQDEFPARHIAAINRVRLLRADLVESPVPGKGRWWNLVRDRHPLRGIQDELVPLCAGDDRLQGILILCRFAALAITQFIGCHPEAALRRRAAEETNVRL